MDNTTETNPVLNLRSQLQKALDADARPHWHLKLFESSRIYRYVPIEGAKGEERDGWFLSAIDFKEVFHILTHLRLRPDWNLIAYKFIFRGVHKGVVYAVPSDSPVLNPRTAPLRSIEMLSEKTQHFPRPKDASPLIMDAVEGDGSEASFLEASLLSRALKGFGWEPVCTEWEPQILLVKSPWLQCTEGFNRIDVQSLWDFALPLPSPAAWAPRIEISDSGATVHLHTYDPGGLGSIFYYKDCYKGQSMNPETEKLTVGTSASLWPR